MSTSGTCSVIAVLALAWAINVGGCSAPAGIRERTLKEDQTPMLQAEDARRALVAMLERSDNSVLRMSVEKLKSDPIDVVDQERIAIGKWRCNLHDRTFVVTVVHEPTFLEYQGIFQWKEGHWTAELTKTRQS